jgi:hypothetical protein
MSEQSRKDLITEMRKMFNPTIDQESKIANFLEMMTNFPATPMASIRPTRSATPQPDATPENIAASLAPTPMTDKLFTKTPKGAK